MSGFDIATILDKKDRTLPKPFNIRPGYDMKYAVAYISHYGGTYANELNQIFDNERLFDTLSTIKQNETPVQWAIRVRIPLQNLLNAGKFSVYHRLCLFASFGKGKFDNFNYYRPRIHKSHMAICFGCWKLIKIDDVQSKKIFHFTRRRYVDYLKPSELMISHWDNECDKPETDFGKARIIQRAWRNYKNRPESLATRVWEAVENDNTSENKKFLGITPQKIRLPETSYVGYGGRTILVKDAPAYARNLPEMFYGYTPKSWADAKKYQLQVRLSNHVLNLLRQQGYRVIYNKQWYAMLKWIQNPELYIDNKYPPFIRIE